MESGKKLGLIVDQEYTGIEYRYVGIFLGNAITVLRLSLGDNSVLEQIGSQPMN